MARVNPATNISAVATGSAHASPAEPLPEALLWQKAEQWYSLDTHGLEWVRRNLPEARVELQDRMICTSDFDERLGEYAVLFPRGGLTKARKAGFKPRAVYIQKSCHACKRRYIPQVDHDPCIPNLPGIKFACCGHGEVWGYLSFLDGQVLRFPGFKVENAADWTLAKGGPLAP